MVGFLFRTETNNKIKSKNCNNHYLGLRIQFSSHKLENFLLSYWDFVIAELVLSAKANNCTFIFCYEF